MPQMAPLKWLTLFLFFIMIFILFNIMNYYNLNYLPSQKMMMKIKSSYNWKW
uniref:ATP synthase complex subunit 8 n=1 Tax=Oberea yaoshana TaxID=2604360 RepID=A0A5B9RH32_9CUCU|nr:ATP synthase F0 subunit 8 [Oberea yaoshana]